MLFHSCPNCGFNPRARRGRDARIFVWSDTLTKFQSTRPRGARPPLSIHRRQPRAGFNPRARGGRDMAMGPQEGAMHVSIHAPAGGATLPSPGAHLILYSFNPRARGGRDQPQGMTQGVTISVSIHAPAGGATRHRSSRTQLRRVSIHAPAGGATPPGSRGSGKARRFNPRARGGRDNRTPAQIERDRIVSIHAPAGGATSRPIYART